MSNLLLSCAATGNSNCLACMVLFLRRALLLAICGVLMLLKGCRVLGFRVSLISGPGSPVASASFRTQVLTSGVLACLLQGKMYPDLSHFLQRTRSVYSVGGSVLKSCGHQACSCGSVEEHCISSAKGHGFSSQGTHTYWKKCITWMHCKLLWKKASAKC